MADFDLYDILAELGYGLEPKTRTARADAGALRGEFTDDHSATTIAHLPAVRLAGLKVRLRSVREQRRIAAELREELPTDAMDVSIRGEQEAIEAMPAALLRHVFSDPA